MSLERYLTAIEAKLDEVLPRSEERPAVLHEAMRYAVGSGGKRLRPVLCLAAAEAVGGRVEDALGPACAVELLHNYTLVHDDLPAMDNDVLRRGRPTVWKTFGEATAILAGDALLALAYRTAAAAPRNVAAVVDVLGEKGVGVVQGQVEDVEKLNVEKLNVEKLNVEKLKGFNDANLSTFQPFNSSTFQPFNSSTVDFIYRHKTADLFVAAAKMGALAGGGTPAEVDALGDYAENLGLAFQYEDDLLDGDSPYSREETEARARTATAAAIAALDRISGDTTFLKSLAERLIGRKN